METYRIMAQTAAEAAASRVAEKLEARMRAWQTNQESLLGNATTTNRRTSHERD